MKSDFGEGTLWFENIIIVLLHPAQLIAEYLIRTFGCPLPIVRKLIKYLIAKNILEKNFN